jgi:integrase
MSGTVLKRGSRWYIKYDLQPDPVTGKRRPKMQVTEARTRKEAQQALNVALGEVAKGNHPKPSRQTLGSYLEEWLRTITSTVSEATLYSYQRNLRLHVIDHIGSVLLTKVDPGSLNGLYAKLLAEGRKDGRAGGLSPRSVQYIHTIVHRAFKDAVRWGRLIRNPVDAADPPKPIDTTDPEADHADGDVSIDVQAWPAEVLADFLARSKGYGDRYYGLWAVLATTGARRGEILGLRWSDVDFDTSRAAVRQTVICVNHQVRIKQPKTKKSRRSLALDPDTIKVLKEWRRRQSEEKLLLGPGYRDHGLVFAKLTGEPLHPERVSREFERRIERWGLERITLHGLRHTWATLALAKGVHPKVVQERLGHSAVSVTLDLYSETTPVLHEEAANLIGGLILG